jgi:2-oxoglutarate ferredoxin oxidoreductase subunit gamma
MDIRFSGFGGQGIIKCGLITGKALSLFDDKNATLTQSIGPEARGSAASSQLVISSDRVLYPYIVAPEILVCMSQEAYEKYEPDLRDGGLLLVDEDLVKHPKPRGKTKMYSIPATRIAEELGNKIVMNLVMIGFFTAITEVVPPEAIKKALPGLVPGRFLELNEEAFDRGYKYGREALTGSEKSEEALV